METLTYNNTKSTPPSEGRGAYTTPQVQLIALDNEISLALQSSSP